MKHVIIKEVTLPTMCGIDHMLDQFLPPAQSPLLAPHIRWSSHLTAPVIGVEIDKNLLNNDPVITLICSHFSHRPFDGRSLQGLDGLIRSSLANEDKNGWISIAVRTQGNYPYGDIPDPKLVWVGQSEIPQ